MLGLTACNDYLDIMPENSLPTENMWKTKYDVESALYSGYYNLRSSITSKLIDFGELRAGCVKQRASSALDKFEIKSTNSFTDWKIFYKIVADANGVIARAEKARSNDETYTEEEMKSHLCEAYFLRALSYFYIVRNWRDAPMPLEPYESDEVEYYLPQTPEKDIIAQIKNDLYTAIGLNAAKEAFDTKWETKGRATIWAIYALMADVCLWNSDFDEAVKYADMILESKSADAPKFITATGHSAWFDMFNPGNSTESIFELQYSATSFNGTTAQTNSLPYLFYPLGDVQETYLLSDNLIREFNTDYTYITSLPDFNGDQDKLSRTMYGTYNGQYLWKYTGGTTITETRTANQYDPNFIIYRVAEVMLIKAEALIMRNMGANAADNGMALELINKIRTRSNLNEVSATESSDFGTLFEAVMTEEIMEFVGEGKAWYDMLRWGRYTDPTGSVNFVDDYFIPSVIKYNTSAKEAQIKSVLLDKNAWYLPVNYTELSNNPKLVQNPYYQ